MNTFDIAITEIRKNPLAMAAAKAEADQAGLSWELDRALDGEQIGQSAQQQILAIINKIFKEDYEPDKYQGNPYVDPWLSPIKDNARDTIQNAFSYAKTLLDSDQTQDRGTVSRMAAGVIEEAGDRLINAIKDMPETAARDASIAASSLRSIASFITSAFVNAPANIKRMAESFTGAVSETVSNMIEMWPTVVKSLGEQPPIPSNEYDYAVMLYQRPSDPWPNKKKTCDIWKDMYASAINQISAAARSGSDINPASFNVTLASLTGEPLRIPFSTIVSLMHNCGEKKSLGEMGLIELPIELIKRKVSDFKLMLEDWKEQ